MERRNFLRVVGAGATVVALKPSLIQQQLFAADGTLFKTYEKVQLVGADGKPVKAGELKKEVAYVFRYPHVSTPCFLLNLPEAPEAKVELKAADGTEYVWEGAVGKEKSIVAFSAICPHQMTHPNKQDSFISYIREDQKTEAYQKGGVVVCGSHLSVFDVRRGGQNVSGVADQPLASIVLEHAADDTLWAVAVLGPDKFHDYFKSFKSEFKEEFGNWRKAKKLVKITAPTVTLSEYSKQVVQY